MNGHGRKVSAADPSRGHGLWPFLLLRCVRCPEGMEGSS
jgi:hypothetical protein